MNSEMFFRPNRQIGGFRHVACPRRRRILLMNAQTLDGASAIVKKLPPLSDAEIVFKADRGVIDADFRKRVSARPDIESSRPIRQ